MLSLSFSLYLWSSSHFVTEYVGALSYNRLKMAWFSTVILINSFFRTALFKEAFSWRSNKLAKCFINKDLLGL